jgi:predicted nucleic acid-binding protein
MPDRLFIDTNILVYLANEDSQFHRKVVGSFKRASAGYELWTSRQVLREYAVVMTRPDIMEKPLSLGEVISDIEKWQMILQIADENEEVTKALLELIVVHQVKGKRIHDANIVASMKVNFFGTLWTMNVHDFQGITDAAITSVP